jgi:hypothetical protein
MLLIFDLNGTLGFVNKDMKKFASKGIYTEGENKAKPIYEDHE